MNISHIRQFALDTFRKSIQSKPEEKETSSKPESGVTRKDSFESKNSTQDHSINMKQLLSTANAAPDIRKEKMETIGNRITGKFYSDPEALEALATHLAELV